MEELCRLCSSTKFVSNDIFNEETALYLKMSLYLPIKVSKNDRLPQKICDKCSCKVNDMYQFCNEAIEVQHKLRSILFAAANTKSPEANIDLTLIKENVHSPPSVHMSNDDLDQGLRTHQINKEISNNALHNTTKAISNKLLCTDQATQTDIDSYSIKSFQRTPNIKTEPIDETSVKTEQVLDTYNSENYIPDNVSSDEDISLLHLKQLKTEQSNGLTKGKRGRPKKSKPEAVYFDNQNVITNGKIKKQKKRKRKKQKSDIDIIVNNLQGGGNNTDNGQIVLDNVKAELSDSSDWDFDKEMEKPEITPNVYYCCMCDTETKSKEVMLEHYKLHLEEADDIELEPPKAPPPLTEEGRLTCPRCSHVCVGSGWQAHWARHWRRDARPLRCKHCGKTFATPHKILQHGMTHRHPDGTLIETTKKVLGCDLCAETFAYMTHLLSHRTLRHPESASRPFTLRCALCTKTFAHKNSLWRHLRAHTGERNFLCNVCGKALSSKEHLKFHIRIHTGYKPYICKTCGKGFSKKCNLTLHERVHSGEKPHVCPHCGKAFSQRSTLVIHERYHSGARPYVCSICGRGFVAQGLLSMHNKTKCCERN